MLDSNKLKMLLGTILGNCLVLVIYHLWPDIPADAIQWVIGGISSAGIGGLLGQGLADGMSKGLTSSNFRKDPTTWQQALEASAPKLIVPKTPNVGIGVGPVENK